MSYLRALIYIVWQNGSGVAKNESFFKEVFKESHKQISILYSLKYGDVPRYMISLTIVKGILGA
jgi:hypothetical protein